MTRDGVWQDVLCHLSQSYPYDSGLWLDAYGLVCAPYEQIRVDGKDWGPGDAPDRLFNAPLLLFHVCCGARELLLVLLPTKRLLYEFSLRRKNHRPETDAL